MGNVERCDKTLPLNEMMFHVILRLFYGASANANSHSALEAYKRAYPKEAAESARLQAELDRRAR